MLTRYFVFSAMILFVCASCGKNRMPDGMPVLVPYQVKVAQEGKPVPGACVVFKGEQYHYVVDGVTNDDGIAMMKTQGRFNGIPCDQYKVQIEKIVRTPSKYEQENPPSEGDDREYKAWQKKLASEYRPTHSYIEAKYGDIKTSGFTVTVTEKGESEFDVGSPVDIVTFPPGTAKKP